MRTLAIWSICVTLLAADPDSAPAIRAAERWLPLVDRAQYDLSWERAAASFRSGVTKAAWREAVAQARKPLGAFRKRTLSVVQFVKDPPNSPPGRYFILQYDSDFTNKRGAVETAVIVNEDANVWKTAGYFIK